MSGAVNVLAVIDATVRARNAEWFRNHDKYFGRVAGIDKELDKLKASENEAIEARAAVAELIEALSKIAHLNGNDYFDGGVMATRRIARNALARVQGGAE